MNIIIANLTFKKVIKKSVEEANLNGGYYQVGENLAREHEEGNV